MRCSRFSRSMTGSVGGHGPDRPCWYLLPFGFQKVNIRCPLFAAIHSDISVNQCRRLLSYGELVSHIRSNGCRKPESSRNTLRLLFSRCSTFARSMIVLVDVTPYLSELKYKSKPYQCR